MALLMHIAIKKKKNYRKGKYRYSDIFLVATIQTPPRQHQKSNFPMTPPRMK
jgi:hypothetical protein